MTKVPESTNGKAEALHSKRVGTDLEVCPDRFKNLSLRPWPQISKASFMNPDLNHHQRQFYLIG